jgi:hypothetical protein
MMAKCRPLVLLAFALICVTAVACAPSGGASTNAKPPQSAGNASANPSATDPVAKIVAGSGWNQVRLGASASSVQAALGAPDTTRELRTAVFHNYLSRGIEINYAKATMQVDAAFFYSKQADKPEFASFVGSTDRGIGWSSTADDVLACYGAPSNDYKSDDGGVASRRLAYPTISFRFEEGRLVAIAVGAD